MSSAVSAFGGSASNFVTSSSLPISFVAPSTGDSLNEKIRKCESLLNQFEYSVDGREGQSPHRQGALFCRTGNWLEILDSETAHRNAQNHNQQSLQYIKGTRNETSLFTVLEFISIAFGLISIRGIQANKYLCMDAEGALYGSSPKEFTHECIFREEMLENYYNLYSSCAYGGQKKNWYVALRKTGRPRRGKHTRRKRKSSHFIVVHFDKNRNKEEKSTNPRSYFKFFAKKNSRLPLSVANAIRQPVYHTSDSVIIHKDDLKLDKNNTNITLSELLTNTIVSRNKHSKDLFNYFDTKLPKDQNLKTEYKRRKAVMMNNLGQNTEVVFKEKYGVVILNDSKNAKISNKKNTRLLKDEQMRRQRKEEISRLQELKAHLQNNTARRS
uniref:FGF n=1 Tax=Rhabditophanes sp. KR3021 TaxID=114890 RepID=A0AC35U3A4_9BILA